MEDVYSTRNWDRYCVEMVLLKDNRWFADVVVVAAALVGIGYSCY